MTDRDLPKLLARRNAALEITGGNNGPLARMEPADRQRVDAASRTFAETTASIVAILRRHNGPVRVGDVALHLSADRMTFIELDAKTGQPVYVCDGDPSSSWRGLLYRYPAGGRNCPADPMHVP